MNKFAGSLIWAASTAALAQAVPSSPLPTRMQFCQQELQGVEGDERRKQLRECLLRRADAEKTVSRDCRRQVGEVPGSAAEKAQLLRSCELRALSVPYASLPKRAAKPKIIEVEDGDGVAGTGAGSAAEADPE